MRNYNESDVHSAEEHSLDFRESAAHNRWSLVANSMVVYLSNVCLYVECSIRKENHYW